MGNKSSQNSNEVPLPLPGIDLTTAKKFTAQQFKQLQQDNVKQTYLVLHSYIFDVTAFLYEHPGGAHFLTKHAGQDATEEFEANNHSSKARSLLVDMFQGILVADQDATTQVAPVAAASAAPAPVAVVEKSKAAVSSSSSSSSLKVFYATQKGTAKRFAQTIVDQVLAQKIFTTATAIDLKTIEPEDLPQEKSVMVFVMSTYTDGKPTDSGRFFVDWLVDACTDFRVHKGFLSNLRYSIFGLGNSIYEENFNKVALEVDKWMLAGGAKKFAPNGVGDDNIERKDIHGTQEKDFQLWLKDTLIPGLLLLKQREQEQAAKAAASDCGSEDCACKSEKKSEAAATSSESKQCCKTKSSSSSSQCAEESCCSPKSDKAVAEESAENDDENDDDEDDDDDVDYNTDEEENDSSTPAEPLVDLEDLGSMMKPATTSSSSSASAKSAKKPVKAKADEAKKDESGLRQMVTPEIRAGLTKQGYRILGSHSGVKLCRWTKAMLRGRGGCYKHSFYGITSYSCMEMTPSLSCANKCVFCWRKHTNPVGKEWKWQVDEPEFLVEEATKNHLAMIKQMKGVPGVTKERLEDAQTIRHCALSLVGEPIMYPHINRFVALLHSRRISSFLVTNAQFPDRIRDLQPVTQLYVSVDAATPESLKAVDRPLFKDFWERYLDSLSALGEKKQRTVYRLTLVKAWNMEEVANYASLIARGNPEFIEIKGVTFCGTSDASNLTMQNVPFHEEVVRFAQDMLKYISDDYELACEHAHSCCLLIAHKKYKVNGKWHTWINYDRFHELVASGQPFTSMDYCAPTPEWAVFGSQEAGFDPAEQRTYVKGAKKRELSSVSDSVADMNDFQDVDNAAAAANVEPIAEESS